MESLILKDGTKILFEYGLGFKLINVNKTIPELEKVLTKDNLSEIQMANKYGKVYGKHSNMILFTISKDYTRNQINVELIKSK